MPSHLSASVRKRGLRYSLRFRADSQGDSGAGASYSPQSYILEGLPAGSQIPYLKYLDAEGAIANPASPLGNLIPLEVQAPRVWKKRCKMTREGDRERDRERERERD